MIVAGLQLDTAWEDPVESFRRAEALAAKAAAGGAGLLALPEMFATGFSMAGQKMAGHASDTRSFLTDVARRYGTWVLGGFVEPGAQRPRNSCALMDPTGAEVLRYHKIHPFTYAGEHQHYEGGADLPTATMNGIRVTPLICYDLRFPELFRAVAEDTDLFVVIANWPIARRRHWTTLLRARAIECQCYVLGVNRVGEGDGLQYAGDTMLVDPLGETLASAAMTEAVVLASVQPATVASVRAQFGFLADRRPSVYARLLREQRG